MYIRNSGLGDIANVPPLPAGILSGGNTKAAIGIAVAAGILILAPGALKLLAVPVAGFALMSGLEI